MTVTHDTVTMREAARLLGISKAKIWRLARDGVLPARQNPLDRREKLVRLADLQQLRAQALRSTRFVSGGIDTAPIEIPAREIKDWVRQTWLRSR